jgi:hypothetical protein
MPGKLIAALLLAAVLALAQYTPPAGTGATGPAGPAVTYPPYTAVTDGAPITWAIASASLANGTITLGHLTATRALNITNPLTGGFYTLIIKQDSTGGAALTLGTGCVWKVAGGGLGAFTLTTAASAIDILTFTYDGTNCYASVQPNFN